jgi:hypothetical protein
VVFPYARQLTETTIIQLFNFIIQIHTFHSSNILV